MEQALALKYSKETLWWLITAIGAFILLWPVYETINPPFMWFITFVTVLLICLFRFNIFFRQVEYLKNDRLRKAFMIVNVLLFSFLLNRLQFYFQLLDNFDFAILFIPALVAEGDKLIAAFTYFRNLLLVSTIGSMILLVVFQLRLIQAQFRKYTRVKKEKIVYQRDVAKIS